MNELIELVIGQLGMNEGQAKGALGLVFKILRGQVDGDVFNSVKEVLPDVEELIGFAPDAGGGLGGMLGGLGGLGKLGNAAKLAAGLKSLDLDLGQAQDLIGQVTGFLESKGKGDLVQQVLASLK